MFFPVFLQHIKPVRAPILLRVMCRPTIHREGESGAVVFVVFQYYKILCLVTGCIMASFSSYYRLFLLYSVSEFNELKRTHFQIVSLLCLVIFTSFSVFYREVKQQRCS
uniref:Putative secreted peptide n=1 Tax=Anopheles braziliensis TaxID=58242 RepID=A0A2M3ZU73_9DIPT